MSLSSVSAPPGRETKKAAGGKPATFGCTVLFAVVTQTTVSTFRSQVRPKKKKLKKLKEKTDSCCVMAG
jgi:hypothetical protein